jgi:hypothetical protein
MNERIEEVITNIIEHNTDLPEHALRILIQYGQIDGAHHKTWVIDQAVRLLAGSYYDELIESYKENDVYEWNEGIAP